MARPISDILPGILERCAEMMGIQYILGKLDTDLERKSFILDCHTHELIDDEQCALLITAHMLENA
ncbi:hypothetical protein WG907_04470 [Sphingobium sp. AN558]|uniref:hypothetical protein n=1 Tax=Sphingobium sp. AN558 TaxID=3133442 RepID=UPI0030BCCEAA